MQSTCFQVKKPDVINETIDGETVIINLMTGNYYSLDAIGAEVWDFVERRASTAQIVDDLARRYESPRDEIEIEVARLLEELQTEALIVAAEGAIDELPEVESRPVAKAAFRAPKLEKYTDMQELILLDPVHEVDDRGWPHQTAEG